MFEFWLKEFIPRYLSMEGEAELIGSYILGCSLHTLYWLTGGTVMLYKYFKAKKMFSFYNRITDTKRPRMVNPVYLPMGILFVITGLFFAISIIAVWHNYLRLSTLLLVMSGLTALVNLVRMPGDVAYSDSNRNCDELREEVARLQEAHNFLIAVRRELEQGGRELKPQPQ